jgi:hypothetical protein
MAVLPAKRVWDTGALYRACVDPSGSVAAEACAGRDAFARARRILANLPPPVPGPCSRELASREVRLALKRLPRV